jgi:hypothetical protein
MKQLRAISLGLCFVAVAGAGLAQEMNGPPPVLQIDREFLKPGRAGSAHAKTEAAFVQAATAGKSPTRYLAMDSMSGESRSLFFFGFPSFAAMEKQMLADEKNTTMTAALDRASMADGDLLNKFETSVWSYREDMSAKNAGAIPTGEIRYFEIDRYKIRPGHLEEWNELVKLYKSAYEKAIPDEIWAIYENNYGFEDGGVFLIITPMRSLTEVDKSMGDMKQISASVGKDGMKKITELTASCVESTEANLFRINPKISYPDAAWVKADPAFWKPKPAAAAKKPDAAPAQ